MIEMAVGSHVIVHAALKTCAPSLAHFYVRDDFPCLMRELKHLGLNYTLRVRETRSGRGVGGSGGSLVRSTGR